MLGNILEILFVLGFAATIVAVVAVAFALVVPTSNRKQVDHDWGRL